MPSITESMLTKWTLYFLFILITMLIILYVILIEYTEGHHDPEGISIAIDININIIAFDYWVYFDKMNVALPVYIDNNIDYFIFYIIWIRWRIIWSATCHFVRSNWAWLVPPWSRWYFNWYCRKYQYYCLQLLDVFWQ